MTSAFARQCATPGCGRLANGVYCDAHKRASRTRDTRLSRSKRGYDRDWYRLRKWLLGANPLCVVCGQPATDFDHIVPLRAGGERLDPTNIQSLCHSCHSRKTAAERVGGVGGRGI